MCAGRGRTFALAWLAVAACGGKSDLIDRTRDAGDASASIDATVPVGDDATVDASPHDVAHDPIDEDLVPVDGCTACIIQHCAGDLATCLADPPCRSGWEMFELCRGDGGTFNCFYFFGTIDDNAKAVLGCAQQYNCCNP
jgi:hypothetical protein